MKLVTSAQIESCLQSIGLQAGDGVLVHAALQFLGKPQDGPATYLAALRQILNIPLETLPPESDQPPVFQNLAPKGTLAVPTFNFGFGRGEPYYPRSTPSQGMGVFAELVRQQPGARRSPHPMQSLAVIGAHAADLASRDTPGAFDPGSAFERLLELDFKLLLLGADIQAVSLIHYSEQRAHVPYRYWKNFQGEYRTAEGWQRRTYRMLVRDLEVDARLDIHAIQRDLEGRGLWQSVSLNYGKIAACRLRDFVASADRFLQQDAWIFVTNRPQG
jgi:aminoglycoside N3'-acetyltransferase